MGGQSPIIYRRYFSDEAKSFKIFYLLNRLVAEQATTSLTT